MSLIIRIALWGPLLAAALLVGGYIYAHDPFARDGTELLQVPLSEEDTSLEQIGDLKYLGGLDIPRMGQNIGGLSGLRWDAQSGRLLAITDDARWVWITPEEREEQLEGLTEVQSGALLGLDGEVLLGKEKGDSESLTSQPRKGGWIVGFERDHRAWYYSDLSALPVPTDLDPQEFVGPLEENNGFEALAGNALVQIGCVERQAAPDRPNCGRSLHGAARDASGDYSGPHGFSVAAPKVVSDLGGVPTDADALADGTVLILFRSYSPSQGNTAAIVAYTPDGTRREIATFLPPLTLDNFEGLAVREEGEGDDKRTFLYIVSDDNFSGSQRTLLMKFELLSQPEN